MTAMTDVTLPNPRDGVSANWTLIYTAAGAVTILIQNRAPSTDVRVRVNGSAGAAGDALTSPYQILRPFDRASLTLATGDKVFATPDAADATITAKVTIAA